MVVNFFAIRVGSLWTRPELATLWGYKAYQALARGVVTPAQDNKIILFVTQDKQASTTNYRDVLAGDKLEWEGPNDHYAESRMLAAKKQGETIHLFYRKRHHAPFEYKGELAIVSSNLRLKEPSEFVFKMLEGHQQS